MHSASAAISATLSRLRKSPISIFLVSRGPVIAAVLVVICFIFARLSFFLHFRLVDIAIDYWSYFDVVQQARNGNWPKLTLRTPGYPLFLALVFSISRSGIAVVIAQCIFTLAAALGTLACFVRADRRLAYPAAFALIGFTASTHSVVFDTTLMSESLYCSFIMIYVGALSLAILRGGWQAFAGASLAMTGCLLTRPAGFFLFGIYGLTLIWLLFRRQPRRQTLAFAMPLAILVLATCAYNRLTIGSFTVTPFGAVNMLGAVATYIEEDPDAPAAVNAAIREIRNSMTPEDRATVLNSYDPDELSAVFSKYYDAAIYTHMAKVPIKYMELTQIYKRLARLAIRQHPDIYLKFASANFYKFYDNAIRTPNLYAHMAVRYNRVYGPRTLASRLSKGVSQDLLMEYWNPAPQPHVRGEGSQTVVDTTWSRRAHEQFNQFHDGIFARLIWFLGAILLFPVAVWKLIRSRAHDARAFLVIAHVLALVGAGLVIGLVQMPMTRYGATALFLGYLTPLCFCLLVWNGSSRTTDLAK